MKNLKLFQKQLRQKIELASDRERVTFGFDICKRLLSEYEVIAEQGYLPGIDTLDDSIKLINNYLEFNLFDPDDDLLLINQVELISPVTDNLSDYEASYVLNTIASIDELLMYLGDKDTNHIFELSELMIKTIELKILDSSDQILYEDVDNQPIFTDEIKHQIELFNK